MGARALLASSQPASGETTTAAATTAATASGGGGGGPDETVTVMPRQSSTEEGLERIPWKEDGYLSWEYDGYKINYVDEGDKDKVRHGRGTTERFDSSGCLVATGCGQVSVLSEICMCRVGGRIWRGSAVDRIGGAWRRLVLASLVLFWFS